MLGGIKEPLPTFPPNERPPTKVSQSRALAHSQSSHSDIEPLDTSDSSNLPREMKFTLPANAFPELVLTLEEQKRLIHEANCVLDETIHCNEEFLAGGRTFPRRDWKPVRAKEGIRIYKQRNTQAVVEAAKRKARAVSADGSVKSHRESTLDASSASSEPSRPSNVTTAPVNGYVETLKRPQVPLLVLHGILDGTLEDTMYGCFADTDESWRWRSTHVNERFDDARILTKVLGPTPAEPFRFLGVKWFIKEHPAALNQFVKRRDFLILEATGITKDSNGDPVGYLLMHSMAIPRIPELRGLDVVRANLSFCFLIRPHTETTVEIYCRGFTDPQGDMIESVSVLIASESLMSAVSVVDYSYVKKLKWLMMQRQQQHNSNSSSLLAPSHCESCYRSLNKFGILSPSGSACHICRKVVCSKCSLVKKVTVDLVKDTAVQRALKFCLGCVLEAKELPAWDLASATLPPPPAEDEAFLPPPPLKRVSSRGQPRLQRAASTYSNSSATSAVSTSRRSDVYTQLYQPQQLPTTPGKSATRSPPPPVPQSRKTTSGRSSEATRQ